MSLPTRGTLIYNGIEFDALYKSRISTRYEMDDAQRTIKYAAHTLTVTAYITAGLVEGANTDGQMDDIRRALGEPGGKLQFEEKGFGTLTVNTRADDRDQAYGPIPKILTWTPVGDWKAALIEWSVTCHVPEHATAKTTKRFSMFNISYGHTQDIDGYSTITATVVAEIPVTRISILNRTIPDHIDRYKKEMNEAVGWQPPQGFRRTSSWQATPDGRRGTLTVTFEQLPTPLPDSVSQCEVEHELGSELQNKGFKIWDGTISATMSAPAGTEDKSVLLDRFMFIVTTELGVTRDELVAKGQKGSMLYVTSFRMRNSKFGKTASFYLTYRVAGADLAEILVATKMWKPIADFKYDSWATSLTASWRVNGNKDVKFDHTVDAIVDVGTSKQPGTVISANTNYLNPPSDLDDKKPQTQNDISTAGGFEYYWNNITLLDDQGIIEHRPLGNRVGDKFYQSAYDALKNPSTVRDGNQIDPPQPTKPNVYQAVIPPVYTVVMTGVALRVGKQIPIPALLSVGGVAAVRRNGQQLQVVDGYVGGYPRYKAAWRIEYSVKQPPSGKLTNAANPVYAIDGTANDGKAK